MNENHEPNVYVERLDNPTKRETNLLFQVFEWKLISADLFKAIVGLTPEEYKDGDKTIDVREELHLFVDRFFLLKARHVHQSERLMKPTVNIVVLTMTKQTKV